METQFYEINGLVIDEKTGEALYNLKVEAWDKDKQYNDLLGVGITNANGAFNICFDSTYFREDEREKSPDIFFKVYMGKKFIASTEDRIITNAGNQIETTIEISMPRVSTGGKDRISAKQVVNAAQFFYQSDFRGVLEQVQGKAGTPLKFMTDMVANTFKQIELKPVQTRGIQEKEIIGQDTQIVSRKLREQKIMVDNVYEYNPSINSESFNHLGSYPANLRAGQHIDLYEQDGKVCYYANSRGDRDHDDEIGTVRDELDLTKKKLEKKDAQISELQKEIELLRTNQDEINTLLKSKRFLELMKETKPKPKRKEKET